MYISSPYSVLLYMLPKTFKVYTPWCMGCDTTSKQVEKLAKHFKGLENLIFAKIDAAANEHPKLEVSNIIRVNTHFLYCFFTCPSIMDMGVSKGIFL